MQSSRFDKFLAIAGILAGIVFVIVGFHSDPPGVDADAHTRLQWYVDHKTMTAISGFGGAYFAVLVAFFAVGIRRVLRSGEAGESTYSSAALVGGTLVAATSLVTSMLQLAVTEAADKGQTAVVTTFAFIGDFGWLPLIGSLAVFYLATGLGGLRTATLPKWLSIVTIVMGAACVLGPAGIGAWFATPLWLIVVGGLMLRRGAASTATAPATAPAPSYAG